MDSMETQGTVQNGVVVFDRKVVLPEGTRVVVSWPSRTDQESQGERIRVQLPLVTEGEPGSIALTNQRIQEIFEEEDITSLQDLGDVSS